MSIYTIVKVLVKSFNEIILPYFDTIMKLLLLSKYKGSMTHFSTIIHQDFSFLRSALFSTLKRNLSTPLHAILLKFLFLSLPFTNVRLFLSCLNCFGISKSITTEKDKQTYLPSRVILHPLTLFMI